MCAQYMLHPSYEALLNTAEFKRTYCPPPPPIKRKKKIIEPATAGVESDTGHGTLGQHFACVPINTPIDPNLKLTSQRTLTVARFGRIYKRKMPSKWLGFIPPVCQPGQRFCRVCNGSQPISAFYTNVKRYICKRHHYERVSVRFKARMRPAHAAPERNAEHAWFNLNTFSKILGYKKLCYDRHDIMDLIRNTKIPLELQPRAIPIDPRIPMRPRNVAIIRHVDFSMIKAVYEIVCSQTVFTLMVQAFNLLPPNADAGRPWNPFHDPSYIRQDCNAATILGEESQRAPDRPVYDAITALRERIAQQAITDAAATLPLNDSSSSEGPGSSSTQSQTTSPEGQPLQQAAQ
jgi:hypothetical protein